MATLRDYVATEFATFDEKPLGEVDSLVFTQLAMIRMAGLVPLFRERIPWRERLGEAVKRIAGRGAAKRFFKRGAGASGDSRIPGGSAHLADLLRSERFDDMFVGLVPGEVRDLLLLAAASPRFRDVAIHDYQSRFSETERTQFAAMSFTYRDAFTYVAFRGTDRSFTGWKEDFDMAYAAPVPAQEAARRYVDVVGSRMRHPLILGGHSKGGNLAVYAAAKACPKVAERITAVYDHDGPGFSDGVLTDAERERVLPLVRKTVPQESLVGLLMEGAFPFDVVKSSGHGIEQHSPFRWQVEDGKLVRAQGLAASARFTAEVLNEWIAGMGTAQRRRAVDALFAAIAASGAHDAVELLQGGPKALGLLVEAARSVGSEERGVILGEMKALVGIAARKVGSGAGAVFSRGKVE